MSSTQSIQNTDRLNYVNIGLMLFSLVLAYFVPFELFLFSYAVLGPAHYLTEISWLHERKYFSNGKRDYILLAIAGIVLFFMVYGKQLLKLIYGADFELSFFKTGANAEWSNKAVYVAFAASLGMVLLKNPFHRFIAVIVILFSTIWLEGNNSYALFFSVFLPTLIHVFLFTALFMLYGALKGRSRSGYLSVLILLICPVIIILYAPSLSGISDYARTHYTKFEAVNLYSLDLWNHANYPMPAFKAVFDSRGGVALMRFIAFAYTYHYLNWFSKTTVIKWHNVPKKRLIIIGILWLVSVGFYWYSYEIGFNILFLLSFLHVFLEFPLNHVTIIGIFKETRSIFSGKPVQPVPVKKGSVKKK